MKKVFINKVILKGCCSGSQPCKQRDHQTLRAARLLRMTDEMSSRSVSTPVIPQCLYAGYRSFLLRPILRIQTLRNDEAAGVRGFTLVELLVVVLIIGILSAIAIPMYQGAVDKSHWSTMLPASKAIKDAEEAFKMTNGEYSDTMEHLDVQINNADLQFTLNTPNNLADPNVIRVTNSKLDNVRLASYLDDSPMFAGQLHCEVKEGDERATRLCEKLLGGQELNTVGGYTRYLLDQSIDQATCGAAEKSWSTSKTKCYRDTASRCSDLGMGVVASMDDQCGSTNTKYADITAEGVCLGSEGKGCWGAKIKNGAKCIGNFDDGCRESEIYDGGICEGNVEYGCTYSNIYSGGQCVGDTAGGCVMARVYSGGACVGNKADACFDAKINDGAKCIANVPNGCYRAIYYGTGCCEDYGKGYCPAEHKC